MPDKLDPALVAMLAGRRQELAGEERDREVSK
jgi:hypothetical protein